MYRVPMADAHEDITMPAKIALVASVTVTSSLAQEQIDDETNSGTTQTQRCASHTTAPLSMQPVTAPAMQMIPIDTDMTRGAILSTQKNTQYRHTTGAIVPLLQNDTTQEYSMYQSDATTTQSAQEHKVHNIVADSLCKIEQHAQAAAQRRYNATTTTLPGPKTSKINDIVANTLRSLSCQVATQKQERQNVIVATEDNAFNGTQMPQAQTTLVRCVRIEDQNDRHSLVLSINKCCDTLAAAKHHNVVYAKGIPQSFEDKALVSIDEESSLCAKRLADYYIHIYQSYADTTLTDADRIRMDMFTLTVKSVDSAAENIMELKNVMLERLALLRYCTRQAHIIEARAQLSSVQSIQHIHDLFQQLLFSSLKEPSIVFAVDFAMFNIVRRAQVDTMHVPDTFAYTARRYLISAWTQMAYATDGQNLHLRTYKQKASCIQQLNFNSHLFGVIIEAALQRPSSREECVLLAKKINIMLGHALVLNYLSQRDYLLKLILLKIDNKVTRDKYIQDMLGTVNDIPQELLEAYISDVIQEIHTHSQSSTATIMYYYMQIYTYVVGYTIRHIPALCTQVSDMYTQIASLSQIDYSALAHFAGNMTVAVPQNSKAFAVLKDLWQLERCLYDAYMSHNKLHLNDLYHSVNTTCLLDGAIYLRTHNFNSEDIVALERTLTSQYLNKQDDPSLRSYTGMLVELCDPDNRLSDLYVVNSDKTNAAYISGTLYQMAKECAKKAKELARIELAL